MNKLSNEWIIDETMLAVVCVQYPWVYALVLAYYNKKYAQLMAKMSEACVSEEETWRRNLSLYFSTEGRQLELVRSWICLQARVKSPLLHQVENPEQNKYPRIYPWQISMQAWYTLNILLARFHMQCWKVIKYIYWHTVQFWGICTSVFLFVLLLNYIS